MNEQVYVCVYDDEVLSSGLSESESATEPAVLSQCVPSVVDSQQQHSFLLAPFSRTTKQQQQ